MWRLKIICADLVNRDAKSSQDHEYNELTLANGKGAFHLRPLAIIRLAAIQSFMWMACTCRRFAERENLDQKTVGNILGDLADLPKLLKSDKALAEHAVDFDPPIYNIWKQQEKSQGSSHFGNSEVRWLDNLLYTGPFDIVVDPFPGSGSTIDICKKRKTEAFEIERRLRAREAGEKAAFLEAIS
jgi:hypothetical protein